MDFPMTFIMQENFFTVGEPRRGRKQNANQLLFFFLQPLDVPAIFTVSYSRISLG